MADNTLALQVQPTQFGQNFTAGVNTGLSQIAAKQEMDQSALAQKRQSMEALYMMSAGVLRDGEASPEEWDGVVSMMADNGADPTFIERIKGRPDLAKVFASGSAAALKFSQDERLMDLEMQKLAQSIEEAAAPPAPIAVNDQLVDPTTGKVIGDFRDPKGPIEVSPGGTLVDPETNEPIYTAPKPEAPVSPTDDQRELAQINEERKAAGQPPLSMEQYKAPAPKPADAFGNEKDLFQQYSASDPVKTYEIVKTSYERVRESAAQQSGAGDLGLIYGYMRMLDPGSVVRESEFAMAAQAGDYGEQIQGLVSRILTGERLPESQRQEFVRSADALYQQTAGNLADINAQFTERATAAGVDPTRFIREPEAYKPLDKTADGERTTPNGITYRVGK